MAKYKLSKAQAEALSAVKWCLAKGREIFRADIRILVGLINSLMKD